MRYVLITDIFNILRNQPVGTGGEIQLADAIIIQSENDAVKLLGLMGVALIVVAWKAI